MRDLSIPIALLKKYARRMQMPLQSQVLVIGGAEDDLAILYGAGFSNITLSNLHSSGLQLNAEAIALPDASYDVVFAHATLHHCRCPYKAVAEMLRVSRKWVVFFEPNDSFAARLSVYLGLKSPYEIVAVMDNHNVGGGVENSDVPNFIHRWTARELTKAALCAVPERKLACYAFPYWDLNLTQHEAEISSGIWQLLVRIGQRSRGLLNFLSPIRLQGNHFFGAIEKLEYHSWIKDGRFDPEYLSTAGRRA
jgi:SAM-dependent methyltransferase